MRVIAVVSFNETYAIGVNMDDALNAYIASHGEDNSTDIEFYNLGDRIPFKVVTDPRVIPE